MTNTTPAKDLYDFLLKISAVGKNLNVNERTFSAWAKIAKEIHPDLTAPKMFGALHELTSKVANSVKSCEEIPDEQKKLYLTKLNVAFVILDPGTYHRTWLEYEKRYLTSSALNDILILDYPLRQHGFIGKFADQDIVDISEQVSNLVATISESEFDERFKLLLLSSLRSIQKALDHYLLFGEQNLRDLLVQLTGEIVVHWDMVENGNDEAVSKLKAFISFTAKWARRGADLLKLANDVHDLLPKE